MMRTEHQMEKTKTATYTAIRTASAAPLMWPV
jgi:hypothetical protein